MSIDLLFWIVYIVWVIFGFVGVPNGPGNYWGYGRHLVIVVLIGLLGWKTFGPAIHG